MEYLFETKRKPLSPADFIQQQNDQAEEDGLDFEFLPVESFDPLEIL